MKIKLNTNLCPIINVAMYNSCLSLDSRLAGTDYNMKHSENTTQEERDYYCANDGCDIDRYKKDIADIAIEHIKAFFDDIRHIIDVKVGNDMSIWSPRWYNFANDELDFEIEIEQPVVDKIIADVQDNDKFFQWARDEYHSYDGFISFMPYWCDEYMDAIKNMNSQDFDRALSMYFMWLLTRVVNMMDAEEYCTVYQYFFEVEVFERTFAEDYLEDERVHAILAKVG